MNTFFVLRVIFEWSPLIMGGRDNTIPEESKITG